MISVAGTVFAAKALKEGSRRTLIILVIGIVEIMTYVVGVILAGIMFINGQSV